MRETAKKFVAMHEDKLDDIEELRANLERSELTPARNTVKASQAMLQKKNGKQVKLDAQQMPNTNLAFMREVRTKNELECEINFVVVSYRSSRCSSK